MIFSERLKELRESKKISMYNLAKQIGVSDAAVCKWENAIAEPKASNIKNLSEFFEVSSDFLLGLEDELGIKKYTAPSVNSSTPLPPDEQEFLSMYQTLPSYLKDSIFSELKGMYKAYTASKPEKSTRRA